MNDATDTDAGSGFTTGTGPSEQRGPSIHDIQPNWISDGHGIRGPQKPRVEEGRAQPFEIPFAPDNSPRVAADNPMIDDCIPPDGDTSKKYARLTHYVDGKWVCYWLECGAA